MTNTELRCASTDLEVPDYDAELGAEMDRINSRMNRNERDIGVRVFQWATNQLVTGRFESPKQALEFVFDEIM